MWVFIADLYFTKKQAYFRCILAENVVSEICLEHELLWREKLGFGVRLSVIC